MLFFAELVGGHEDSIGEECNGGQVFQCADVGINEHEGVDVCEIVGVEVKYPGHDLFDHWAAAIMLYGIFGGGAALEEAGVEW